MAKKIIFFVPVLGFLVHSFLPFSQTSLIIFMGGWMILWWIFDVAPLGATALIPLIFLPLMDLLPLKNVTPYYADPMIYLFLGGFMIARGLEKTKLSERFALGVLSLTGRSDTGIIVGIITATSLLSMWISNTATAIMMIPIAQSIISFLEEKTSSSPDDLKRLSTVIFLSIAYSANIGGTMTPIGTPPNVLLVGFLENLYQIKIDFWRWMLVMVPLSGVFLFFQFKLLKKLFPFKIRISDDLQSFLKKKMKALPAFNHSQKLALGIFFFSCSMWVFKDLINFMLGEKVLSDSIIALLGGAMFFFLPFERSGFKRILTEQDIPSLPWNIILLFGGGMALAASLEKFGIIQTLVDLFQHVPSTNSYLLIFLLTTLTLVLTEVMSNVALCMIALPLIMSLGVAKGIDPLLASFPAAIAASYAFSLPISTPPNAIVFSSNKITINHMLRAGIILNILGVLIVMTLGWFLLKIIFL